MKTGTDYPVRKIPWAVQWLTWPVIFVASMAISINAIVGGGNYGAALGLANLVAIAIGILVESVYPLSREWRMTRRSFHRDLKYAAIAFLSLNGVNALFGLISIKLDAGHAGPITNLPLYFAVPIGLLAVDFIQYWQHRWSHEGRDPVGRFLWSTHVTHHLSDKVYVLMHPAAHPLNIFLVRGVGQIAALYLLGATPATVLLISVIITVQSVVSHCNADLRMGWFSYVLTGTELHRYHHSTDPEMAKNYAVTLPILDILFGTFRYRPGVAPERLGVMEPAQYPESYEVLRVMLLPFHPRRVREDGVS